MAAIAEVIDDRKIKPYGDKARRFARRAPKDDKLINILEGSVRSGKTWAMLPKILQLCAYNIGGHRLFTGVSKQTIHNNVLDDLFDVLGESNYNYNRMTGELDIMGAKWLVMGAKDEGSEKYVRGLTVGCAVSDELTLQPKNFVMMLLNRLSLDGSRFYATTNPDNPMHFVKTEILDNKFLRDRGDVWSEHFTLDDNPHLSENKKAQYRGMYTGVFKLRYIDGLWVVAEGSIYKDAWSDDLFYDDSTAPEGLRFADGHVERFIGVDCGLDHPQVYLDCLDDGTRLWFDREYFWDSRKEMVQKTDSQYADDLELFLKDAPDAQVIIPPECASFRAECVQRGLWLTDADNEVEDGIKITSSMMARKRIRVNRTGCPNLAAQIPVYSWDPKASARGIEQPLKQNDDAVDAMRYVVKSKIPAWRLAS